MIVCIIIYTHKIYMHAYTNMYYKVELCYNFFNVYIYTFYMHPSKNISTYIVHVHITRRSLSVVFVVVRVYTLYIHTHTKYQYIHVYIYAISGRGLSRTFGALDQCWCLVALQVTPSPPPPPSLHTHALSQFGGCLTCSHLLSLALG